jgi:hypothetical protein
VRFEDEKNRSDFKELVTVGLSDTVKASGNFQQPSSSGDFLIAIFWKI